MVWEAELKIKRFNVLFKTGGIKKRIKENPPTCVESAERIHAGVFLAFFQPPLVAVHHLLQSVAACLHWPVHGLEATPIVTDTHPEIGQNLVSFQKRGKAGTGRSCASLL